MPRHAGGRFAGRAGAALVLRAHERELADVLVTASRDGLTSAAHDVSTGGLAQTLVEMALRSGVGARVTLPADVEPFVALFSESSGRAVVVVPTSTQAQFTELCNAHHVAVSSIGVVDGTSEALDFHGLFSVPLSTLRETSEQTFPQLFD